MQSQSNVTVLGVHGMGGIGKTELANFMFDQVKVGHDPPFDRKAFLSVSKNTNTEQPNTHVDLEHLISELQKQLCYIGRRPEDNATISAMKETMHSHLRHRRCFVVLDDVWEWEDLQHLVFNMGKGSIVLITTREEAVLAECDRWLRSCSALNLVKLDIAPLRIGVTRHPGVDMTALQPLELDKSLEVLCWSAFGSSSIPEQLQDASESIQKVSRQEFGLNAHSTVCFRLACNEALRLPSLACRCALYVCRFVLSH